jgi:hypothetical protein
VEAPRVATRRADHLVRTAASGRRQRTRPGPTRSVARRGTPGIARAFDRPCGGSPGPPAAAHPGPRRGPDRRPVVRGEDLRNPAKPGSVLAAHDGSGAACRWRPAEHREGNREPTRTAGRSLGCVRDPAGVFRGDGGVSNVGPSIRYGRRRRAWVATRSGPVSRRLLGWWAPGSPIGLRRHSMHPHALHDDGPSAKELGGTAPIHRVPACSMPGGVGPVRDVSARHAPTRPTPWDLDDAAGSRGLRTARGVAPGSRDRGVKRVNWSSLGVTAPGVATGPAGTDRLGRVGAPTNSRRPAISNGTAGAQGAVDVPRGTPCGVRPVRAAAR